jgi:hypothetical protein
VEWVRLLVEARSTKISFYEGAAMADSVMPARPRSSRRGAAARLRSAVSTVVRSVTVAAGVFAPGHLGELTRQVPFELVDAVLEQTRATERRLRTLPSRVGVYFVLALAVFPGVGAAKVWASMLAGLDVGRRVSVWARRCGICAAGSAPRR